MAITDHHAKHFAYELPAAIRRTAWTNSPARLLSRCEWGHDDYSLKVENLPDAPPETAPPLSPALSREGRGRKADAQQGLFGGETA